MHGDSKWYYNIENVQISERFEKNANSEEIIPDILITPYVSCYKDRKKSGSYNFRFKEEYYLHTFKWHKNIYKIRCGKIERELIVDQEK
jgi:hypothetical protein